MANTKSKVETGAVVATAILAAVAGSYYLYSKFDKTQKRKVKSWALRLKADVLDELENLQEISKDAYEQVVDVASAKYAKLKNVDTDELHLLAKDMKKHWSAIQKTVASRTKKAFKK
ncbi:MAG: hypothetical protein WC764_02750 [Candidatus Paceibacterota bacterium]|jgi:hypothetical protein